MSLDRVLIVGLGGLLGSVLRYVISCLAPKCFGAFPLGTLAVNILGGLAIGFIMTVGTKYWPISVNARLFLTTGIMGGLTTFSTFSYETISFLTDGRYLMGILNAALNLTLALFACWAGTLAAQAI